MGVFVAVGALVFTLSSAGVYSRLFLDNPRGFLFMVRGPSEYPEYTQEELASALEEECHGVDKLDETAKGEPKPALRPIPPYPVPAELNNIEGHVVLSYEVDSSGSVAAIRVVESEPAGWFERISVAYVHHWRFCPYDPMEDIDRTRMVRIPFEFRD